MASRGQLLMKAIQTRIHVVYWNLKSVRVGVASARRMRVSNDRRTDILRQLEMITGILAVDTSRLIEAIGTYNLIVADRDAVVDSINSKVWMDIDTSFQ